MYSIHVGDLNDSVKDLQVVIDRENLSNSMEYITTKDFKLVDKKTGKELPQDKVKQLFPPNKQTKSYILFARLKPMISKEIKGEKLKLTCDLNIKKARDNGMYNVVSSCAYKYAIDRVKQNAEWEKIEQKMRDDVEEAELAKLEEK